MSEDDLGCDFLMKVENVSMPRETDEKVNPNFYLYRFLKGEYF